VTVCTSCGQENPAGARFCNACAAALEAPSSAHEQRKTVTVLFCDVTGSTSLGESTDPEALRALLARYFERMKGIVEAHGGTVEKFIGDAVMAVFGVPQVHEDDALRAVRAAIEMREALPELGVQARIGINTGEVVTGTEERLATGDAVNVAARLEQAADPGEILLGRETWSVVRDGVEAEPVEPLALKGKAEPVTAFRLLGLTGEAERRHASRFVGRAQELLLLQAAWEGARVDSSCRLVTLLGDAGVGKSRLVAEFLAGVDARVVKGRCLSYGDGITYWPVIEVLKQLGSLPADPATAQPLRSLLRETDEATSAEEIAWSFRKLLEQEGPLVVVLEDIHWGEETFLDLIEHVALLSSGAAILLLCLARQELIERRPQWPAPVRLGPLPDADAAALIPDELAGELRERISRAAGGNPLFLTEMAAMARDAEGEVAVPPSLQALLAARLDQLEQEERFVLERGAVEGELFHRGSVQALSPDGQVTPKLAALVRKELIRPDQPQLPAEDAFRFRHLLIRDAAYDALPKAMRADLHERFAAWLEVHGGSLVEVDEIVGYHLEQAVGYKQELGRPDPELAERAGRRLAAAGRRAHSRMDAPATSALLKRATGLLPSDDPELPDLLELFGYAKHAAGDLHGSIDILRSAQSAASAAGQRNIEIRARMSELIVRVITGLEPDTEGVLREAREAIAELQGLDDPVSLHRAWHAVLEVAYIRADFALMEESARRRLEFALPAGMSRDVVWAAWWLTLALADGPLPVDEAIPRAEEALGDLPADRVYALNLALLYAYACRDEEAKRVIEAANSAMVELGQRMAEAVAFGRLALLWGDLEPAESQLRAVAEQLHVAGWNEDLSAVSALLAEVLYALGRDGEAETWTHRCEQAMLPEQIRGQADWRATRAQVLARRGEADEALRLAADAVEWARRSDGLVLLGSVLLTQGEVAALLGRPEEARASMDEALAVYERKQIVPLARRAREQLAALEKTPA
jgi:class 3 adenylate cyclase/tetratricopeptide (TPR) repeat protein